MRSSVIFCIYDHILKQVFISSEKSKESNFIYYIYLYILIYTYIYIYIAICFYHPRMRPGKEFGQTFGRTRLMLRDTRRRERLHKGGDEERRALAEDPSPRTVTHERAKSFEQGLVVGGQAVYERMVALSFIVVTVAFNEHLVVLAPRLLVALVATAAFVVQVGRVVTKPLVAFVVPAARFVQVGFVNVLAFGLLWRDLFLRAY